MRHKCEHPGCGRSYIRREHLFRHARDHANRRPFTCSHCPSRFNRRDTLNRHTGLNHDGSAHDPDRDNCNGQGITNTDEAGSKTISENGPARLFTSRAMDLDLSSSPAIHLLQSPNRTHLQDVYFSELHPHWPILHRDTFINTPQSSALAQTVLTAGLWMTNDVASRAQAESYHNWLLDTFEKRLFHLQNDPRRPLAPRLEVLPDMQTLLLVFILAAYRGTDCIPIALICNKLLIDIFKGAGVFDQQRIDEEFPTVDAQDWIMREQFQRLALVQYKLHLYFNALLAMKYPVFRPSQFLTPQIVKVRLPCDLQVWDASTTTSSYNRERSRDDGLQIHSLFSGEPSLSVCKKLSSVVAWDFSLGMALGCLLTRQPNETEKALTDRTGPFMFLHLKHASN